MQPIFTSGALRKSELLGGRGGIVKMLPLVFGVVCAVKYDHPHIFAKWRGRCGWRKIGCDCVGGDWVRDDSVILFEDGWATWYVVFRGRGNPQGLLREITGLDDIPLPVLYDDHANYGVVE